MAVYLAGMTAAKKAEWMAASLVESMAVKMAVRRAEWMVDQTAVGMAACWVSY